MHGKKGMGIFNAAARLKATAEFRQSSKLARDSS
jgi:hypothetical protein